MNESNLRTCDFRLHVTRYEPGEIMEFHEHHDASVGIILGGSVAETVNGQTVAQRTGALVTKPAGVLHRDEFGAQGAVILSIRNLPAHAQPARWAWLRTPGLARQAIAIAAELKQGDLFGAAQEGAWSILAAISSTDFTVDKGMPPVWLNRIRDEVASSERRPSVGCLARSVGVHPVYLTRLFRKHFGCSITTFYRRQRTERAAESLLRKGVGLAEIAAAHGFSDQSHFCRTFKHELGVTPSVYRLLVSSA